MKRHFYVKARCKQIRGVAAVEFAILLPLLLVLLTAPLLFGRIFWHYTVIQKAAHDAALYLSTVPEAEMRTVALAPKEAELAQQIALAEITDLNPGPYTPDILVTCNLGVPCTGQSNWKMVKIYVGTEMHDLWLNTGFLGYEGLLITAEVQMQYNGTK